ncbi:conserved hypothetical protein [Staphylothermus marinus F1]|uniref:HD domain-containing protein n=1 Tax=Staphylothermus marinus (strain ATCC 43588 / DSM 3639 / JCM 9404 / F1) TaxID=399550 RepID=A3DM40_STAMF|nr:HD family hydrolase [Staphylothermus marinus]ABN69700.1 conserved hypothetical protein [Staphylothermus marinus F1]
MELKNLVAILNNLVRTGWMIRGVPRCLAETVSQHTFVAAIVSLVLSEKLVEKGIDIDPYRVVAITLTHDLIEAYIGDIPSNIDKELENCKTAVEKKLVGKMFRSKLIRSLLEEFLKQETMESRIAKLSDRIATYIQAVIYKEQNYNVNDILENMEKIISKYSKEIGYTNILDMIKEV